MNTSQIILGIFLLTLGIASGLFWLDSREAESTLARDRPALAGDEWARLSTRDDVDSDLVAILKSIEVRLETQQARQDAMALELAHLQRELVTSDKRLASTDETPPSEDEAGRFFSTEFFANPADRNEERLVSAGFSPAEAREINERLDSIAMERLNLRYEMAREGDSDRQGYRQSIANLPSTREFLQANYGDDAYDRYLYASGRSNRVVVRDVYRGSAADEIGLLPGDMVLAFDHRPVYSARDLMAIATNGNSGESIALTILRNGSQFELYLPRGPLGITTRQTSVKPGTE